MEQCFGCGIATKGEHPMVAVMSEADAEGQPLLYRHTKELKAAGGETVLKTYGAAPVCERCWIDPAHRMLRPIKGMFCKRGEAKAGVQLADAQNLVGSFTKA